MDQHKKPTQPAQQQGSQPTGQENWNERQTQNPNRDPVEGPRQEAPGQSNQQGRQSVERQGQGPSKHGAKFGEKTGGGSPDYARPERQGGGITNRELDREQQEQQQLPPRGSSDSER